ncbi:hypothetical protein ANN_06516 [Periplaneta americana]|uniref:DUF4706 domain-containing protein n=2 Tax=Periplaneta americana TaxID=6978 RepID=A0ABQ8TEG3_PERAM|nr:hypothetical protein ANN_06516 [Periplaneta americana]
MSMASVQSFAEEYFNSLNPIAERISVDVAATRDAYEDLWHTLSYKDQNQVINETIIYPEAVLKYSFYPQDQPEVEYFPRLRLQTGDKYITDDEGVKGSGLTWRDEHSAPFTWMTQSQLNLCSVDNAEPIRKRLNTISNIPVSSQQKQKFSPSKKTHTSHSSVSFVDPPSVVLGGSSSKLAGAIASKLKFPPKSGNEDDNLLTKIKNKTALLKIQTLKSTVSKTAGDISCNSKEAEREILVQHKSNSSVVCSAKSKQGGGKAVISKPKTPPPPPPCKPKSQSIPAPPVDSEKTALLQESLGDDLADQQLQKQGREDKRHSDTSLDSLDNFHVELKIPSGTDTVPKTGFDFLDN